MNQSIALITAFAFMTAVSLYQATYAFAHFNDPKVKKVWIWLRLVLSFIMLIATLAYAYFFFLT